MMHWVRALSVFTFLVFSVARDAHAIDDPSLEYYSIETPHFYVHYYSGLEALAQKVAVTCEEAHLSLQPLFAWVPANKTHVFVIDRNDSANGSATTFARNKIVIYGMPPEPSGVLGFYDDWIRVLVYHEYVHILHLDTVLGISPYINMIIGKQFSPNQTAPRWYIEGLATYHESKRTRGGRVNGAIWKMWSRAAALSGELFELGTATGTPVTWPFGTGSYLYGSLFLQYVFDKYGEDFGMRFNHIYGSRIIPWSLNRTANEISGQTLEELWDEWLASESAKAIATKMRVKAQGRTLIEYITKIGGDNGHARERPGRGEVTFFSNNFEKTPAYGSNTIAGEPNYTLFLDVNSSFGPATWTPDGRYMVYSMASPHKNVYSWQDLYRWDSKTQSTHRLTTGERAREPVISPDGKRIVYVRNVGGTMELVSRAWGHFSGGATVLVGGTQHPSTSEAHWQQIASPRFSPDSKRLVFSQWRLDSGRRDIYLYDFEAPLGQRLRALTHDFAMDLDPVFDPVTDDVLFASDRDGIFNIYAYNLVSDKVEQVSNVVNGVWAPEPTTDGKWIYVTSYTSKGYEVARFSRHKAPRVAASPALQDDLPVRRYDTIDTSTFRRSGYHPWKWLAPLTFTPDVALLTSGTAFAGTIAGEDPAGRHLYQLSASVTFASDIENENIAAGAFYAYTGAPVDISVLGRVRDYPSGRSQFVASDYATIQRRQYFGRIGIGYPILSTLDSLSLQVSFNVEYNAVNQVPQVQADPGDLEPVYAKPYWSNELGIGLFYSNLERFARSISVERGVSASTSFTVQDPALGSDFEQMALTYSGIGYLPNPWVRRHVLAAGVRGGLSANVSGDRAVFSVGGALPQDVLSSIVFQEPLRRDALRGYLPGAQQGSTYQIVNTQYRFPILDLDHGFGTLPVFFRQVKGSVFFEAGTAYSGFWNDAEYLRSAGAEVLLSTTFGYYFSGNLRLGYAYGFDEGGIHDLYLVYGGGF